MMRERDPFGCCPNHSFDPERVQFVILVEDAVCSSPSLEWLVCIFLG